MKKVNFVYNKNTKRIKNRKYFDIMYKEYKIVNGYKEIKTNLVRRKTINVKQLSTILWLEWSLTGY